MMNDSKYDFKVGDTVSVFQSDDRETPVAIRKVKSVRAYPRKTKITLSDDSEYNERGDRWKSGDYSRLWSYIRPFQSGDAVRYQHAKTARRLYELMRFSDEKDVRTLDAAQLQALQEALSPLERAVKSKCSCGGFFEASGAYVHSERCLR